MLEILPLPALSPVPIGQGNWPTERGYSHNRMLSPNPVLE